MVFSGLYPIDGSDYPVLREALDKLKLSDASLNYEPETSVALGFGFRCGFLGLLHLEIVTERLEREFDLDLISTAPSVTYEVTTDDKKTFTVTNPSEFPVRHEDRQRHRADGEGGDPRAEGLRRHDHGALPVAARHPARHGVPRRGPRRDPLQDAARRDRVRLLRPAEVQDRRVRHRSTTSRAATRRPTSSRSTSCCRASTVDAFSAIVHRDKAYAYGVLMTERLKKLIPRQQFEVPIQAAIGARIIARESIRAMRKDVLAKCYGGDITRKRKLLEKQKEGKKRMKMVGRVEVPQEAFIAALSGDTREGQK